MHRDSGYACVIPDVGGNIFFLILHDGFEFVLCYLWSVGTHSFLTSVSSILNMHVYWILLMILLYLLR